MEILNKKPKEILNEFLPEYLKTHNVNFYKSEKIIKNAIKKHSHNKDIDSYFMGMENLWYESLERGVPDYSLYDDDYYFTDIFSCFIVYSRKYILSLKKNIFKDSGHNIFEVLNKYDSVVDLGCGVGYSTSLLSEMFKDKYICATNLKDTKQYKFCKRISEYFKFDLFTEVSEINRNIDIVFASEYFEHIERPIEHLKEIINEINPKCFILANAFNTRALGHFLEYKDGDKLICQSDISKMFNNVLKENGYVKKKTNLWNNRPAIFIKDEK